ncbi:MAG: hypothetical protein U0822_03315 [Anaerolineae bacterium]
MPPGFHITTATYGRFVAANDLQTRLLSVAAAAHPDAPPSLDAASAAIAALFAASPVPDDVADAYRYGRPLGNGGIPSDAPSGLTWPGHRFDLVWVFDQDSATGRYHFTETTQHLLPGDKAHVKDAAPAGSTAFRTEAASTQSGHAV